LKGRSAALLVARVQGRSAAAAHNPVLAQVHASSHDLFHHLPFYGSCPPAGWHRPILHALEQRDPDEAGGHVMYAVQGATALYNAWKADCAAQGIDPGSQKAFSQRIQRRVGYDRNNGRPRYCHVRLKPAHARVEHAPLRLAVVNG